jgi:hypothetical protein
LESDLAKTRKDLKASQSQKRELEYRLESLEGELKEEKRGNTIVMNDLRKRLEAETKRAKGEMFLPGVEHSETWAPVGT